MRLWFFLCFNRRDHEPKVICATGESSVAMTTKPGGCVHVCVRVRVCVFDMVIIFFHLKSSLI